MYKSRFNIPKDITKGSKIYVPLTICYEPHSILVSINGLIQEEFHNFNLVHPVIDFESDPFNDGEQLTIEINYYYKRSSSDSICQLFTNNIILASWFGVPVTSTEVIENKRKEIFIKHYIDAQFALDSGMYKESVLNFGTALEVILNRDLSSSPNLQNRIDSCSELGILTTEMHRIRTYRNKVHPNQLLNFDDVTRKDAYDCRTIFERVLKHMVDLTSPF